MCSPGTDAGRDRPLDPDLAKALAHPLRQRILEQLTTRGEASPSQLARSLDEPVANVAYHVKVLLKLDCVELVGTRQRRGALEHYYRPVAHPWLGLARTLHEIVADASAAGLAGGFEPLHAQVTRVNVVLDEQGWQDVAVLLERMLASAQRIRADSAIRAAEHEPGEPTIEAEIALLLFRRAQSA
jgi:DNA-binding transcriptional ArsR family regulator